MSTPETATAQAVSPVEARLDQLRRIADDDPAAARDWAWAWFHELGAKVATERGVTLAQLNELFRNGTPPGDDLDGPTEGMLVTTSVSPAMERAGRTMSGAWMPWMGKAFAHAEDLGHNRLRPAARWPSKLLWPRYEMWSSGGESNAFRFKTRVEAGADDPDRDVLVLDYAAVTENPSLIRKIRDELVEIVPGAYLGKVLWRRRGSGDHALIGYFALRLPS